MTSIDLNADLGEGDAYDDELLATVSSCNIACGGHAGDEESMRSTVRSALQNGVSIGAHPSYPDREGFGRCSGFLHGPALVDSLSSQIAALNEVVHAQGATIVHVKPHGALYNDSVRDPELAQLIARVIRDSAPGAAMVGLPDSEMAIAAERHSLRFVSEGFIDRAYRDDGQLVPRSEPGAVHEDVQLILRQARSLVGRVDTLCIHGDTPGAANTARAVRSALLADGVNVRAISRG